MDQTQYYIDANLTVACWGPILMNLETYKGFPPEVQKILLAVGKEVKEKAGQEVIGKWWARCEKEWKAKGIGFITISEGERQKWASHLEDIPAEFAKEVEGKGYPGYKIVKIVCRLSDGEHYPQGQPEPPAKDEGDEVFSLALIFAYPPISTYLPSYVG